MNVFSERVNACIAQMGGMSAAIKATGISQTALHQYRNGQSEPSRDRLIAIARGAGANLLWLATGEGTPWINSQTTVTRYIKKKPPIREIDTETPPPEMKITEILRPDDTVDIPLYSARLSAGAGGVTAQDILDHVPLKRQVLASLGDVRGENLAAFIVSGDSMHPTIYDGSTVVVDRRETEIRNGVYAFSVGDDARIKRLNRRINGDVEVISDNNFYRPEVLSGDDLNLISIIGRLRVVIQLL